MGRMPGTRRSRMSSNSAVVGVCLEKFGPMMPPGQIETRAMPIFCASLHTSRSASVLAVMYGLRLFSGAGGVETRAEDGHRPGLDLPGRHHRPELLEAHADHGTVRGHPRASRSGHPA